MSEEALKAVWNFDGAELNLIFEIKVRVSLHLTNWDLENAYWSLRDLRREIDAKLNRTKKEDKTFLNKEGKAETIKVTEKEYVDRILGLVEEERTNFLTSRQQDEDISRFYLVLEEFYIELAALMKHHGLYFREGADPSKAIWER